MVDRNGLHVKESTVRWLSLISLLLAIGGPFVSFYVATAVDKARNDDAWKHQNEWNSSTRAEIADIKATQNDTIRRIDERLQRIEQAVSKIQGQLERQGRIPGDPHTHFAGHT